MSIYVSRELEQLGAENEEPLLSPEVALRWLVSTGRVAETLSGCLMVPEDLDHLGLAGLAIAVGSEPQYLTDHYIEASNWQPAGSVNIIKGLSLMLIDDFSS